MAMVTIPLALIVHKYFVIIILRCGNKVKSILIIIMTDKKEEKGKEEDTSNDEKIVTLTSAEEKKIPVPFKLMKKSMLVKSIVVDSGFDEPIPAKFSEKAILAMVDFMKHYESTPVPEIKRPFREKSLTEFCTWEGKLDDWLAKYLDMDLDFISEMIMLVNFMDYQVLYEFLCASFAFKFIIGKNAEGIRKQFTVENDFTDEESKKVDFFFIWNKLIDWDAIKDQKL